MFKILRDILKIPELRRRILWTLGLLAVFRVGFFIYLPGIDIEANLDSTRDQGSGILQFLMYTSALTGAMFTAPVLFSLGIMPYISASIIFSLMVKVFPRLEALSKEGDQGRRVISRYTRYFTLVLCLVQALFLVLSWHKAPSSGAGSPLSLYPGSFWLQTLQVLTLTGGSMFLMWLGEKITEVGIGNGTSLIIMVGIIANMPGALGILGTKVLSATEDQRPFEVSRVLILFALYIAVIAAVVFITKGQRRIPVQQQRAVKGRRVYGGQRHFMPLKVNAAGVLPIIFAQSLITIPSLGLGAFAYNSNNWFFTALQKMAVLLQPNGFLYYVIYAAMIFFFTYFWTSIMFNPVEIAGNMKEYGSFIPGIRPGKRTAEYLEKVMKRITLAGAAFLCVIAMVPMLVNQAIEVDFYVATFLGGTGILIVVGVALDLVDKVESQLLVRQYEGFMRGGEGPRRGGGPEKKQVTL